MHIHVNNAEHQGGEGPGEKKVAAYFYIHMAIY